MCMVGEDRHDNKHLHLKHLHLKHLSPSRHLQDKKHMSPHLQHECHKETAAYLRLRNAEGLIYFSIGQALFDKEALAFVH